jgi:archaellum component FlaG (FlaF/FlaG flagellin family)
VIAVAAAVLAYIWIIGYQGTLTQQASTAQLQERIKIEAVELSGTDLKVYVRNIGDVAVTVDHLYVYDHAGTVKASSTVSLSLNPGDVNSGTVSVSGGLTSGETYTVKAVTTKGTEATYTFTYRA